MVRQLCLSKAIKIHLLGFRLYTRHSMLAYISLWLWRLDLIRNSVFLYLLLL